MDLINALGVRKFPWEPANTIRAVARRIFLPLWCLLTLAAYSPAQNPQVDQPLASATFVNIYWDNTWDADNGPLTKETIDLFTQKMIGSTYFKGLSEYGVTTLSFAGSVLPSPSCVQKAPGTVGFYNPFSTSIAGFIECERNNGPAILRTSGVVYNVILPTFSIESDPFTSGFCTGTGSPVAWHFHGVPGSLFNGQPIYTITQANPACGNLFDSIMHEMVEALTDPYPIDISIIPPKVNIGMTEIADVCEGKDINMTLNSVAVQAPSYWSKQKQKCINFKAKVYLLYNAALGQFTTFVSNLPFASAPTTVFNQRRTWTQVVGGNFGGHGMGDFLFYDTNAGVAEFFSTDETGQNLTLFQTYTDWSHGWTIVPGNFGGTSATGQSDLLLYNVATGNAGFFDVWGPGNINLMRSDQWSPGHTIIVPGNFGGTSATGQSDLLIYDGASGNTAFYDVWGLANINLMRTDQWNPGHTIVVTGNFGGTSATGQSDLLIYDGATGGTVFMDTWGWANLAVLRGYNNWSAGHTIILSGDFGGTSLTGQSDLLIYDSGLTRLGFLDTWGQANVAVEAGFTGLPQETWSLMASSQP